MDELSKTELETAYLALEAPLYNFALRWVWNPSLAQELVQDAFIRVWRRRSAIDRSTLKALLYKTVQNLAINERRKNKLREMAPVLDWVLGNGNGKADDTFILQEDLSALKDAIENLPKDLRETLLLCQFSDLSYQQIAENLGIPAGTVASRKNRAMGLLREKLSTRGDSK